MSNIIKLKRGSGSDPSASDLVVGEVALRTDSGKLFTKKDNGNVAEIGGSGISDGDKGDITVSNSGDTFTIDSGVISSSKLAASSVTTVNLDSGAVTNDKVNANAAIAGTKISPDFGSQAITTTGQLSVGQLASGTQIVAGNPALRLRTTNASLANQAFIEFYHNTNNFTARIRGKARNTAYGQIFLDVEKDSTMTNILLVDDEGIDVTGNITATGNLTISNTVPHIDLNDTDNESDYRIRNVNGTFQLLDLDQAGGTVFFQRETNTDVTVTGNFNVTNGVDVTGNITVTGTVDGVDIAARDTLFGALTSSSGVLTNGVTATTQSAGNNTTRVATTAFVSTAISNLVDSAPGTLNTLNELAAALGDDANFSTTVTNSIATKLPLAGGTLTGNVTYNDNVKAIFGTHSDLEILHNSSENHFNFSANTFFKGNSGWGVRNSSNQNILQISGTNRTVELYGGSRRVISTASAKLTVRGGIEIEDSEFNMTTNGNKVLDFETGGTNFVNFRHNPSDSSLSTFMKAIHGGAVELYHDASGTKTFETTSTGIQVDGTDTNLTIRSGTASGSAGGLINFKNVDANGVARDVARIKGFSDGTGGYGEITFQTAFNNSFNDVLRITKEQRLEIIGSNQYPVIIDGSDNAKMALQGSNNPYIYFREGTTNKGYIQWHSDGDFRLGNDESGEILKIKSGADGLTFTHDGTESKVFHAGNDGSGSGLDSDLLDGVQGSSYLRSDADDTLTGDLTLNGRLVANHGSAPATGANFFFSDDGSTTTIGTAATFRVANNGGNAAYSVFEAESGSGSIRLANDGKFYVTGSSKFSSFVRTDISSDVDGYMGEAYSSYFGLKHTDQTLNSEYMIISKDFDTFISATSGYKVRLRAGGNDGTNELQVGSGNDALTWRGNKVFHAGNDGSGSGLDSDTIDGLDSVKLYREVASASATVGAGWMTVAENTSGRRHGEIIVSDSDSSDHSFIRIDWMRSYNDSCFTVINCGGHSNRITGVRVLRDSNDTYGNKKLQVYVTVNSTYRVQINQLQNQTGWTGHAVVTPVIQASISGYQVDGSSLENLNTYNFSAEQGIQVGSGGMKSGGNVDITGNITLTGTVDGRDVASDGSKLDGIESGATADQTGTEIRALLAATSNTNIFNDTHLSKLNGIAAGATNVTNTNQLTNGAGFLTSVGTSNISNNAVTLAKMQQIGSPSFLGRNSSATGNVENLSVSDVRTMLNVENGATADQTASEILSLLVTVDGSGSGLDADTLDGIGSSAFLRSDADDTMNNTLTIGTGSGNSKLLIKKVDNNTSDHLQFYNGTTRVGEIGCEDNTWLRINQETNKNIYTPRYIRADNGFFVDGTSKGINGSGNFIGGTIAGASDYGTLLRSDADDTASGKLTLTYSSQYPLDINATHDGKMVLRGSSNPYIRFRESNTDKAYIQWNSNGNLYIVNQESDEHIALGSGTNGLVFNHSSTNSKVFHAGNDGSGSGLDSDTVDGLQASSFLRSDAADVIGGVLSYHSNEARLQFRNTSYNAYLYIGGWDSGTNSNNISRIRNSNANLHIDSGANGDLYLNWYASNRNIYLGQAGQTVRAAGSNVVFHAGNDGSGSGLDSDTVDGIQGSSFLRSDAADSASGDITFGGGGGAVTIAANSDIRLSNGNWTGNAYGKIQHHSNYLYIAGGSSGIILREDGTDRWIMDTSGHFRPATNNTYDLGTSSARVRNINASGIFKNDSRNEVPSSLAGAIHLQSSTSGGNTGIFFNSKVNANSDAAYIWWYDDNNNYRINDSGENGALVIGIQNDGNATSEDAIAIESSGNIFLNPGNDGGLGNAGGNTGPDFNEGKVYIGRAATKYEVIHTNNLTQISGNIGSKVGLGTTTGGTPGSRAAFLALGDNDTGVAQNGDGQLELWANNQEIMNLDTGEIEAYKQIIPSSNNSINLGSSSRRWANVYVNDMHFSNEGKTNDIDGSWGDWTLQEGEEDIFMINNRTGKKFKIAMIPV